MESPLSRRFDFWDKSGNRVKIVSSVTISSLGEFVLTVQRTRGSCPTEEIVVRSGDFNQILVMDRIIEKMFGTGRESISV